MTGQHLLVQKFRNILSLFMERATVLLPQDGAIDQFLLSRPAGMIFFFFFKYTNEFALCVFWEVILHSTGRQLNSSLERDPPFAQYTVCRLKARAIENITKLLEERRLSLNYGYLGWRVFVEIKTNASFHPIEFFKVLLNAHTSKTLAFHSISTC